MIELDDRRAALFVCQRTSLNFIILEGKRFDAAALAEIFWTGLHQTLELIGVSSKVAQAISDSYSELYLARFSSASWTARLNAVAQDYKHRIRNRGGVAECDIGAAIAAENDRPRQILKSATAKELTLELLAR
jgi:hypothetical protein